MLFLLAKNRGLVEFRTMSSYGLPLTLMQVVKT